MASTFPLVVRSTLRGDAQKSARLDVGGGATVRRAGEHVNDLLEQSAERVYRFALRLTGDPHSAEDVTQETILRAWKNIDRLRDREPKAARVWLFQIAVNLWRDQQRRSRHRVAQAEPWRDMPDDGAATPDRQAGRREELQRALTAMNSLPDRQRQVLYLASVEQMSLAEICEALSISNSAAKSSLSLARKSMRQKLGDLLPERLAQSQKGNERNRG